MAYDDIPVEAPVVPTPPPQPPAPTPMETRNVLNQSAQVIGLLSLPVGTIESVWTEKLAQYAQSISNIIENLLNTLNLNASAQTTTSSATPATITGMSAVPTKGKYIAIFSGSIYTAGASAIGEFGIYVDGVLLPETRRDISCSLQLLGGLVSVSLNSIGVGTYTGTQVDLNGAQTLDVRFRSTNGGTIGFKERVLTLLQVQ